MENNKQLILGMGEVGQSLRAVLKDHYNIFSWDSKRGIDINPQAPFDIMHICFPYSKDFIKEVKKAQKLYAPTYTIIHSTVPVGVSRKLNATHSPIRGLHPNLETGIRTFPKFLGGEQASLVADYFRRAGIKVILCDKQETTEALKLWDTQQYLESVRICQEIKKYCDKHNLPFSEVYTLANQTYNSSYTALGMPEVVRPVLQPIMTQVGGHCLLPNEELLKNG